MAQRQWIWILRQSKLYGASMEQKDQEQFTLLPYLLHMHRKVFRHSVSMDMMFRKLMTHLSRQTLKRNYSDSDVQQLQLLPWEANPICRSVPLQWVSADLSLIPISSNPILECVLNPLMRLRSSVVWQKVSTITQNSKKLSNGLKKHVRSVGIKTQKNCSSLQKRKKSSLNS